MAVTRSIAKLEVLMSAWTAYQYADRADDGSFDAAKACIKAQNRLVDACVDCGMPTDGDEFAFAAKHVTRFLLAA